MQTVSKEPLPLDEYDKFSIAHEYSAFVVEFKNISQEKADDIENDYQLQRYKIFHSDISINKNGSYDLKLVIASLSFTF